MWSSAAVIPSLSCASPLSQLGKSSSTPVHFQVLGEKKNTEQEFNRGKKTTSKSNAYFTLFSCIQLLFPNK